jgi:hypothetical protein
MSGSARTSQETEVVLHLGAHRTGTTLIQKLLARNRAGLRKQGVRAYVSGDDFCWRLRWLVENEGLLETPENARGMLDLPTDCDRIVISEENLFCTAGEAPLTQLYAERVRRLEILRELFVPCRVRVLFYVRDHASFIESCYLKYFEERAAAGHVPPTFENYVEMIESPPERLSWLPMTGALCANFTRQNVYVNNYRSLGEDGPRKFCGSFFELAGVAPESLDLRCPRNRVNPSLSRAGVSVFWWLAGMTCRPIRQELMRAVKSVDRRLCLSHPRYFDVTTRRELNAVYRRDCERISGV